MNDFKPLHIVFCPGGAIYEDGYLLVPDRPGLGVSERR